MEIYITVYLIIANLIAICLVWYDKYAARQSKWRVKEAKPDITGDVEAIRRSAEAEIPQGPTKNQDKRSRG